MKSRNITYPLLALAAACIAACGGKQELKECRLVVESLTDSALVAHVDGRTVTFAVGDLRMSQGVVIPGDSAVVRYTGDLDGSPVARMATVIPKSQTISTTYDPSRDLLTAEPEEETPAEQQ